MLVFDRENWPRHRPWFALLIVGTLGASAWYGVACLGASRRPGGGSLPGLTFGVVGGLICLFEFLLWPRKTKRTWRIGRVEAWMRAHIWLGLLCLPLLVLHSGFHLGGRLSTALMAVLVVVVASGVWGLALQQILPRRMLDRVPAETIYSQIRRLRGQFRDEADRLVVATCGPAEGAAPVSAAAEAAAPTPHLVVGAVRSAGRVQGKVLQTIVPAAPVPESEPLRALFGSVVAPYLDADDPRRSPLHGRKRAAVLFEDLRTRLRPAAHPAVNALESLCEQRRQLDEQARLHVWLHGWLAVHLPLSIALIVLMIAHIIVALMYI